MRSLVVLSGKGGVGKSSIAASLAIVMSRRGKIVCADCDVDASNMSLLFGMGTDTYEEWTPLSTNQRAVIDREKCIRCGKCVGSCYFHALSWNGSYPEVNRFGCEGCGVCGLVCPSDAISLVDVNNAYVGYARTRQGFCICSAQLEPGNSGSGKVVFEVKERARRVSPDADFVLIDSAAGIGCPVIASVTGSDYAILITEPTQSAFSDMLRALEVVDHFGIRRGIIINKSDMNKDICLQIELFAKEKDIEVIARIPLDVSFIRAMNAMMPVVEYEPKYQKTFEYICDWVYRQ